MDLALPRLAHLDPDRAAAAVVRLVLERARRDAKWLGLFIVDAKALADDQALERTVVTSRAYNNARLLAAWAQTGKGDLAEIKKGLPSLRRDVVAPDLSTLPGILLTATVARLAVVEGEAVDAVGLATLASVDPRTIRAAVQEGVLQPLSRRRPMSFSAQAASAYLHARRVPGFTPASAPAAK
jgi:hypothetical protein